MQDNAQEYIIVGRIGAAHGLKGWVKVQSFTEDRDSLFDYAPWYLSKTPEQGNWQRAELAQARSQGSAYVAQITGCNYRDEAQKLTGSHIAIARSQLPKLAEDEIYLRDLEGIEVETLEGVSLGKLDYFIETGANEVFAVKGDDKERLLPFLKPQVVKQVDLANGKMLVDWDPTF